MSKYTIYIFSFQLQLFYTKREREMNVNPTSHYLNSQINVS